MEIVSKGYARSGARFFNLHYSFVGYPFVRSEIAVVGSKCLCALALDKVLIFA